MKLNLSIIVCILFCLSVIFVQTKVITNLRQERTVLRENCSSLLEGVKKYKTSDSLNVAEVSQLQLSLKDSKTLRDSLERLAKDLDIKVKNLSKVTNLTIAGKDTIKVPVEVVRFDSVVEHKFSYKDDYYSLFGTLVDDTLSCDISCKHDLVITETLRYKGWWIFKKLKAVDVRVLMKNKKDDVIQLKSIELRKRKRRG